MANIIPDSERPIKLENEMRGLAEHMIREDIGLLNDVRDLIEGRITWNDIQDSPGFDVVSGNPIPAGKTEA